MEKFHWRRYRSHLIWGTPRGAGGIPSVKHTRLLFWPAIGRSPAIHGSEHQAGCLPPWMNTSDLRVGMVVLLSIQPCHNTSHGFQYQARGVTSSNRTSFTSPVRTAPWIPAPMATTSSGSHSYWVLPKNFLRFPELWDTGTSALGSLHRSRDAGNTGIFQGLVAGLQATLEQVIGQLLQILPV